MLPMSWTYVLIQQSIGGRIFSLNLEIRYHAGDQFNVAEEVGDLLSVLLPVSWYPSLSWAELCPKTRTSHKTD